jgi:hypothetical protein
MSDKSVSHIVPLSEEELTAGKHEVVTAFFRKKEDADRAAEDLVKAVLNPSRISFVAGRETSPAKSHEEMDFWESLKNLFHPEGDRDLYARRTSSTRVRRRGPCGSRRV